MKLKMDYEHMADALSQAINAYVCCNEEILDGCRFNPIKIRELRERSWYK